MSFFRGPFNVLYPQEALRPTAAAARLGHIKGCHISNKKRWHFDKKSIWTDKELFYVCSLHKCTVNVQNIFNSFAFALSPFDTAHILFCLWTDMAVKK